MFRCINGEAWEDQLIQSLQACQQVIPDVQSEVPVCVYMTLPHEAIVQAAVSRTCLTRRVVEIWGDGPDLPTLAQQAAHTVRHLHTTVFPPHLSADQQTWKVDFVRYGRAGRSGLDEQGKRTLLGELTDTLEGVGGGYV
ncbi:hypothetical protein EON64_20080 [archaeon]|nr:MAG: hypothetical protein EON64_20080 [archaeon]